MARFVRDLAPAEKLELYKKVKGYCLFEGIFVGAFMFTMKNVLDEQVKIVRSILDEEMAVNYMEVYKDYSYGRY